MLNYLWAGMILIGIVYASFTGRIPDITNAAIDSSKEAVSLCITMMGVLSMWMGLMKIAEKGGIIAQASLKLKPLIRFLFPNLPSGHSSEEYIVTNFIANFLGLGWAATPAGLKAMEELGKRGVRMLAVSQCLYEKADLSIYEVGRGLMRQTVASGRDMTTEAAVCKMMWALGQEQPDLWLAHRLVGEYRE